MGTVNVAIAGLVDAIGDLQQLRGEPGDLGVAARGDAAGDTHHGVLGQAARPEQRHARRQITIAGNPETGTLRFLDPWGQPITPPDADPPPRHPPNGRPPPLTPPPGEPLTADTFTWN